MLRYIIIALFALSISGYYNYSSHPEISVSRRWLLFSLRSISIAIILLLLISPILYYIQKKSIAPQIVVLEDNSQSMSLKHGDINKASYLKPSLGKMKSLFEEAGYEVRSFNFADGLNGDAGSSILSKALEQLKQDKSLGNIAGVAIASDGWLRDESLNSVSRMGVSFYVLADSSQTTIPDLAVSNVLSNAYAYRNEPNTIRAEVMAENYSGPAEARLMVANRLISKQSLKLEAGKTQNVDFVHRFTQTGFYPWRVELNKLTNESRLANNSFPGAIEVLSDKERVILISDKPAWDNKFILDAINTNPRWEVESYHNRGGALYSGERQVNNLLSTNLAALIIINNGSISLDANILRFINEAHDKGIGLLYQGLPISELNGILPLQKSNIATVYQGFINPSPLAANYPMLSPLVDGSADLPPVDYYYLSTNPGAEVLATINNPQASPAIAVKTMGAGRSVAFSMLNLWRWQLQGKDGAYAKFISNCLTWLSNKSTGGYEAIYNTSYMMGEEIRIKLRVEDSIRQRKLDISPKIRILDAENNEVFNDYLSRLNNEFGIVAELKEPGTYRFEISDKESGQSTKGKFELSDTSIESRDFGYNLSLLTWMANVNGGKMLYPETLSTFKPIPATPELQVNRREIALYKKWYILTLFILAFCLELYLRRRWGLL